MRATLMVVGLVGLLVVLAYPAKAEQPLVILAQGVEDGAEVYRAYCSACHGSTGAGVPGVFPPLQNNERVLDPAYVEEVARNGLSGPIVVNGVDYDGVMPPPAGLSDAQIAAVAAFISGGMQSPDTAGPGSPPGGTVGATLPVGSVISFGLAFLLAGAVAAAVIAPRVAAPGDRATLPWVDAWSKTVVIVGYFIVSTVFLPSLVIESSWLTAAPRIVQDLIGAGVWAVALGVGIWGLWWAQRRNRV